MGSKSSLMLQDEEIKQISEDTGFSPTQIEKLYSRFAHLDRSNCGTLNKNDLMSIPELAINPLCDRLIQMFFSDCTQEDERINFRQFMRVLATFRSTNNTASVILPKNNEGEPKLYSKTGRNIRKISTNRNSQSKSKLAEPVFSNSADKANGHLNGLTVSLKKKLLFVFRIYDADNDGRISFNDLRSILKMMVGNYIEDVQLDKITTRAFMEVDEDKDGFIEFNEFCSVFSGKDLDDKLRVKFFT